MNDTYRCPSCGRPLVKTLTEGDGILWNCPGCEGRAVTISFLRRGVETAFINHLWHQARENRAAVGSRTCPSCSKRMAVATVPIPEETPLVLDICPACQFVWLDAGEAAQMPTRAPNPAPTTPPALAPASREAVALAQVEALATRAQTPDPYGRIADRWPEILLWEIARILLRF